MQNFQVMIQYPNWMKHIVIDVKLIEGSYYNERKYSYIMNVSQWYTEEIKER